MVSLHRRCTSLPSSRTSLSGVFRKSLIVKSFSYQSSYNQGSIRHLLSRHIDPCLLESQNVFVTIFKGIGPFEVATCLLEILTYDVGTKLPNS